MRVLFDNTEIQPQYIAGLNYKAQVFNQEFKLGSTICRAFSLKLDKNAYSTIPQKVYLYDGENKYATLYVDSYNDEDILYTTFELTDLMVKLNKKFEYDINYGYTVKQLLEQICSSYSVSLINYQFYLDDLKVYWSAENLTQRDFLSYVAEVNGGYAYIDENGNIGIKSFTNEYNKTINVQDCSSFKLGSFHYIDRVYLELGAATHYYPEISNNETLYLNPNNILFVDGQHIDEVLLAAENGEILITEDGIELLIKEGYDNTIDNTVRHIYDIVNGLNFYNLKVERCPIDSSIKPAETIGFALNESTYATIANIDWDYSNGFVGGFELQVENSQQQETKIVSTKQLIKTLDIKVDRELGQIEQRVSDNEGNVSQLIQDAQGLTGYFEGLNGARYITLSSDGIKVSKQDGVSSVNITDEGVYIQKGDNIVASMKNDEFDTTNWVFSEVRQGKCLNVFKRSNS